MTQDASTSSASIAPLDARSPSSARLAAIRAALAEHSVAGFLIPRADRHRGEATQAADERLAWSTGFTGSAGLAAVLPETTLLFVDGRYELQAAAEVDADAVEVVCFKRDPTLVRTTLAERLASAPAGAKIGYDPWLHTHDEITRFKETLAKTPASLVALDHNPVDAVWTDRPARPSTPAWAHPESAAGESCAAKRARLGAALAEEKLAAAVLTLPDSINWLLNIRGADIPHTPVLLCFALLDAEGRVRLFTDPEKISDDLDARLGLDVDIGPWSAFEAALGRLKGARVAVDQRSAPIAVAARLEAAGAEVVWRADPCIAAKALKNPVEIAGARAAHLRDGAAMTALLAWLDASAPRGDLNEHVIAERIRAARAETGARLGAPLVDESFAPIVGFGPNGAIVHYRVDPARPSAIAPDGVLLIDSGGQYADGTTDVTRTVAIGAPPPEAVAAATRVLQGMIAMSTLRFPKGYAGRDIDAIARRALWDVGQDYDHGTGHGVGSFLSVHEGPQNLSQRGQTTLEPGMILSNEPGFYAAGRFGIRIENLILVREPERRAPDEREMLSFETLTFAPIDRRLIDQALLRPEERAWLDAYHAETLEKITPLLATDAERAWLETACRPL